VSDIVERLRHQAYHDARLNRIELAADIRTEATDEITRLRAENERLREACGIVRKAMGTHYNGGVGWMAEFERLAALQETGDE